MRIYAKPPQKQIIANIAGMPTPIHSYWRQKLHTNQHNTVYNYSMTVLIRKLNYRSITLTSIYTHQPVGVYLRSGQLRYLPFLGYADALDAKAAGATPVKLEVYGYYKDSFASELITLKPGEFVQGALTKIGVYAIIEEGLPRIFR
ncbi:hypothetical protein P886_3769 [Alteromonadaceae bacterium 2753L.S.0a.02]|nr:hypothetical protein P886_3769 [Alteromonadaceae bacterium 2753L.S.0a.02]